MKLKNGDWIKICRGVWINHIGRIDSINHDYCRIQINGWGGTFAFLTNEFIQISDEEAMLGILEYYA